MDARGVLRSDRVALGLLLTADLLLALLVAWRVPFQAPTAEYMYPALEFAARHRIASDFLPVGMSGLLAVGVMVAHARAGLTMMLIAISLGLIAAAWAYLRALGLSVRATLLLTAMLSLYPDFLLSYNKLMDVNLTALFLFAVMAAILRALRSRALGAADLVLALLLGAGVTVRTNLVLLLPVVLFLLGKYHVRRALVRAAIYAGGMALVYVAVTAALHGRLFLPHNGPVQPVCRSKRVDRDLPEQRRRLALPGVGQPRHLCPTHALGSRSGPAGSD